MKKTLILAILMMTVVSCSYFEGAERAEKERGRICTYNKGDSLYEKSIGVSSINDDNCKLYG